MHPPFRPYLIVGKMQDFDPYGLSRCSVLWFIEIAYRKTQKLSLVFDFTQHMGENTYAQTSCFRSKHLFYEIHVFLFFCLHVHSYPISTFSQSMFQRRSQLVDPNNTQLIASQLLIVIQIILVVTSPTSILAFPNTVARNHNTCQVGLKAMTMYLDHPIHILGRHNSQQQLQQTSQCSIHTRYQIGGEKSGRKNNNYCYSQAIMI